MTYAFILSLIVAANASAIAPHFAGRHLNLSNTNQPPKEEPPISDNQRIFEEALQDFEKQNPGTVRKNRGVIGKSDDYSAVMFDNAKAKDRAFLFCRDAKERIREIPKNQSYSVIGFALLMERWSGNLAIPQGKRERYQDDKKLFLDLLCKFAFEEKFFFAADKEEVLHDEATKEFVSYSFLMGVDARDDSAKIVGLVRWTEKVFSYHLTNWKEIVELAKQKNPKSIIETNAQYGPANFAADWTRVSVRSEKKTPGWSSDASLRQLLTLSSKKDIETSVLKK